MDHAIHGGSVFMTGRTRAGAQWDDAAFSSGRPGGYFHYPVARRHIRYEPDQASRRSA
jgi:hypothetical protein